MHLCDRIRLLRMDRELTQKQVADSIEVHVNTYARYENDETQPTIRILVRLCRLYGITADNFLKDVTDV